MLIVLLLCSNTNNESKLVKDKPEINRLSEVLYK